MPSERKLLVVGKFDASGVAPQPLETVERTRGRREDVDDEVEVIEEDPLGALVALDVRGSGARVLEGLLHGIGNGESPIRSGDALATDPGERFKVILTNPPFGKKSSVMVVNAEGESERETLTVVRDDFWASTRKMDVSVVLNLSVSLRLRR